MRAVVILATVLECADRAYGGRLQWVSEILNEVLLFSSLLALAGIVLACCEAEQASLPAAAQGFRFERTFSKWHSLWRCPMLLNPRHRVRA